MNTRDIITFFDFSNKKQCTQSFIKLNLFPRYKDIYIYIYIFNKALKTEAHSPLCKLYNLIEWLRQGNREIQGETRGL